MVDDTMRKQQTYTLELTPEEHSEWHALNIEHTHDEKATKPLVVYTIDFEESLAAGMIPLNADHTYGFETRVMYQDTYVPRRKDDGSYDIEDKEPYIQHWTDTSYRVASGTVEVKADRFRVLAEVEDIIRDKHITHVNIDNLLQACRQKKDEMHYANELAKDIKSKHEAMRLQLEIERKEMEKQAVERKKEAQRLEAEREKQADEKKAAEREAMLTWANEHGSTALREGLKRGYTCKRKYVTERGQCDLGSDYVIDWNSDVDTDDRSCPSDEAIEELIRIEALNLQDASARIVWLKKGLSEIDFEKYDYESCEAIKVNYLGYYFYKLI